MPIGYVLQPVANLRQRNVVADGATVEGSDAITLRRFEKLWEARCPEAVSRPANLGSSIGGLHDTYVKLATPTWVLG